jgi:hypothetical protein
MTDNENILFNEFNMFLGKNLMEYESKYLLEERIIHNDYNHKLLVLYNKYNTISCDESDEEFKLYLKELNLPTRDEYYNENFKLSNKDEIIINNYKCITHINEDYNINILKNYMADEDISEAKEYAHSTKYIYKDDMLVFKSIVFIRIHRYLACLLY